MLMASDRSARTRTSQRRGSDRSDPTPSAAAIWAYVAGLTVLAVGFVVAPLLLLSADPPAENLMVLTLLALLGSWLRERDLGPHLGLSFVGVILSAALALVGPVGAAIVGYISHVADPGRRRLRSRLFNAAMTACMGGAGGLVYLGLGGIFPIAVGTGALQLLVHVAVPLVIGHSVMTLLNVSAISVMAHLSRTGSIRQVARAALRSIGIGYFVHSVIAFLFVVLWEPAGLGIFSAVLILAPLLLAQWALSRNAEARRAHTRTVRTLVAALETANPYSSGHSARIAELSERMAPALGVTGERAEQLQFAALLHDIGLIAVAPRAAGSGTDVDLDYLIEVAEHPQAGVRIVAEIEFLRDALPGILHHHERVDGLGYPAGLRGAEIPLFARIIAVADAFDSLTTTRSYREASSQQDALETLRSRAGSHLDGAVVEALAAALSRKEWRPTLITDIDEVRSVVGDVHDHDDPMVSDRYAQWSPDAETEVAASPDGEDASEVSSEPEAGSDPGLSSGLAAGPEPGGVR